VWHWEDKTEPALARRARKAIWKMEKLAQSCRELTGAIGKKASKRIVRLPYSAPPNEAAIALVNKVGKRHHWQITSKNFQKVIADCEAVLPKIEKTLPKIDKRVAAQQQAERRAEAKERTAEYQQQVQQTEQRETARQQRLAAILAKRPPGAEALIVAEYIEALGRTIKHPVGANTKSCVGAKIEHSVAIGWRFTEHEDFRRLRHVAATFPATAHLGPTAPRSIEHFGSCAAGEGHHLKGNQSSRWRVRSIPVAYLIRDIYYDIEDALPDTEGEQ